jgi:hypothetical protein
LRVNTVDTYADGLTPTAREANLDEKLAILNEEIQHLPEERPEAMPGVPPEVQAAIQAAEAGNGMNRQPPGVPNLSLPNLPQLENLKPLQQMFSPIEKPNP